jgi:hypothetical protein
MRIVRILSLLILGFTLCMSRQAAADDLRPLLVELTEVEPHLFRVTWIAPPTLPAFYQPIITMPESCAGIGSGASAESREWAAPAARALYQCAGSLDGETLSIVYPGSKPPIPTVIRLRYSSGAVLSTFLPPQLSHWRVPASDSAWLVTRDYSWLGMEHILTSPDHLLFVLMLVYIGGTPFRILLTVSGFTIAHSITLALSTLKWIALPAPPVEASIALSILFLAREATVRHVDTLTWRYPALVSGAFGLLHGLGFAAALQEIGLPDRRLALSLVSFNLGVELGQVAFILLALALLRACAVMKIQWPTAVVRLPLYATGAFSAFWVLRSVGLMV